MTTHFHLEYVERYLQFPYSVMEFQIKVLPYVTGKLQRISYYFLKNPA